MEQNPEPQTLAVWKRKTALFFASQCITLFGSSVVSFAIVWYVTLKTVSGGWILTFRRFPCT